MGLATIGFQGVVRRIKGGELQLPPGALLRYLGHSMHRTYATVVPTVAG